MFAKPQPLDATTPLLNRKNLLEPLPPIIFPDRVHAATGKTEPHTPSDNPSAMLALLALFVALRGIIFTCHLALLIATNVGCFSQNQ